jgi:hypothetical protein
VYGLLGKILRKLKMEFTAEFIVHPIGGEKPRFSAAGTAAVNTPVLIGVNSHVRLFLPKI